MILLRYRTFLTAYTIFDEVGFFGRWDESIPILNEGITFTTSSPGSGEVSQEISQI